MRTILAIVLFLVPSLSRSDEAVPDPSRIQSTSESVTSQSGRADSLGGIGTLLGEIASPIVASALTNEAEARLSEMWDEVSRHYRFLGERGLLVVVQVGTLKASASTPAPIQKLIGVYIKGTGSDPVRAWAEDTAGTWNEQAISSDYVLSRDLSWFWWIKPGSNGWPLTVPSFEDVTKAELLKRKTNYASVVTPGIALRSRLRADSLRLRLAKLDELQNLASAAQANADTENLREAAFRLQQSAANAIIQLNAINEQIRRDKASSARADDSLRILDGVIQIGPEGRRIADTLGVLGPDAPPSPTQIKDANSLRKYIESIKDQTKASTLEYQRKETLVLRDINGEVELFKERSKFRAIELPQLPTE